MFYLNLCFRDIAFMKSFCILQFLFPIVFKSLIRCVHILYFFLIISYNRIIVLFITLIFGTSCKFIFLDCVFKISNLLFQSILLPFILFFIVPMLQKFFLILSAFGGHYLKLILKFMYNFECIRQFEINFVLAILLRSYFFKLCAKLR